MYRITVCKTLHSSLLCVHLGYGARHLGLAGHRCAVWETFLNEQHGGVRTNYHVHNDDSFGAVFYVDAPPNTSLACPAGIARRRLVSRRVLQGDWVALGLRLWSWGTLMYVDILRASALPPTRNTPQNVQASLRRYNYRATKAIERWRKRAPEAVSRHSRNPAARPSSA